MCQGEAGGGLAVDFFAISEAKNKHREAVIFDFADEPVIAHAVSPELPQAGTAQGFTQAARIVQSRDSFVQEFQNPLGLVRIEFAERPVNFTRQFNVPGHDAS